MPPPGPQVLIGRWLLSREVSILKSCLSLIKLSNNSLCSVLVNPNLLSLIVVWNDESKGENYELPA